MPFQFTHPGHVIKPGTLTREMAYQQNAAYVSGLLNAAVKKYGSLEAIPEGLGDHILNEADSVLSVRAELNNEIP